MPNIPDPVVTADSVETSVGPATLHSIRAYSAALGRVLVHQAIVVEKGDSAFVYVRDAMEDAGLPAPRAPWALLYKGRRWNPWMVVDGSGIWTPAGGDYTAGDREAGNPPDVLFDHLVKNALLVA